MTGVRWREETGFEGKCDYCRSWWPIDKEFWYVKNGLRRCKACHAEYHRLHEAGRRASEIVRQLKNTRAREAYRLNRHRNSEAQKAWRERNKEHIRAYNKAYREVHKDRLREQRKAYYAEARPVILLKKRHAYEKAA